MLLNVILPAFFILKPSGFLRLLIDFRFLNTSISFVVLIPYVVPQIKEIIFKLDKAKSFSTLDA